MSSSLVADVPADQAHGGREQERQAPSPVVQLGFAECCGQEGGQEAAQQQSRRGACGYDGGIESAPMCGCVLHQECGGAGVLAGGGEALDDADQQEQDRRQKADGAVAGDQGDAERGHGHDDDRKRQCFPPAEPVADVAPEEAAQGTDEEGDGEDAEGCQECCLAVGLREENCGDDAGQVAVDGVVEPLDEVADEARGDDPASGVLADVVAGVGLLGAGLAVQRLCCSSRLGYRVFHVSTNKLGVASVATLLHQNRRDPAHASMPISHLAWRGTTTRASKPRWSILIVRCFFSN